MTTTNKDFRVKNGLIVEGNSATVNGNQVITSADAANYALKDAANTFTNSPQQINIASTSAVGLVVKGAASQSASLQEWQNSAGTVLSGFNAIGQSFVQTTAPITASAVSQAITAVSFTSTTATYTFSATEQTISIGEYVTVYGITPSGYNGTYQVTAVATVSGGTSYSFTVANTTNDTVTVGTGYFFPSASVSISTKNKAHTGLIIKAVSGQTASVLELQNSLGQPATWFDSAGGMTASQAVVSTLYSGGFMNTGTLGYFNATTFAPSVSPIVVRGTTSQSANLQEWQNSSGTVLSSISSAGAASFASITSVGAVTFPATSSVSAAGNLRVSPNSGVLGYSLFVTSPFASTPVVLVRGIASQTGDLQQWQNSSSTTLAAVTSGGRIWAGAMTVATSGAVTAGSQFGVVISSASTVGIGVKGAASQTANLQEWQDSAGTVLSGINPAGQIYAGTTASIDGSTTTAITSAAYTSATVAVFTYGGTSLVQAGQAVTVAGVTGGTYNGTWKVTAVTSTTFTVLGSGFTDVAGTGGTFTLSAVGSFVAGTTAITPIVVRGAASQTANLQEWQNSDGTTRATLRPTGALNLGPLITGTQLSVTPLNNTTFGIVVRGAASQSISLQEWQNNAGTTLASIGATGALRISGSMGYVGGAGSQLVFQSGNNAAYFTATSTAGSYPSLIIRGITSQTSDLQQWMNSAGTILANVSSSGGFTVPSLTVSGDLTVNGTTTNINTTNLVVEDKNIVIGDTVTPTDITADGGGITLKGTTDKTFNWVDSTDSWTSSEHVNLASGKSLYLNGTLLKDATETLTNKTLTSPTIDTPLLTLSTTSSTTDGRIAWDSTNDKILVGGTLNSVSQAVEFASSTLTISTPTFTTNAYTVVLTDKDKWLELSNGATAGTLNIPTDATANFAIGTQLNILQTGAGQITIAAVTPGTTTVNGSPGLKLRGQWSVATIVKRAANTWVAVGDLSA